MTQSCFVLRGIALIQLVPFLPCSSNLIQLLPFLLQTINASSYRVSIRSSFFNEFLPTVSDILTKESNPSIMQSINDSNNPSIMQSINDSNNRWFDLSSFSAYQYFRFVIMNFNFKSLMFST
jgi:hypothetical protein